MEQAGVLNHSHRLFKLRLHHHGTELTPKARKDTLNWPCIPQKNSFNLSPKSSLKWKMSGNEYKSPTILFGSIPPLVLGCFLQSRSSLAHTYFVATQLFLTPRAVALPAYPPHPDSPVCLFQPVRCKPSCWRPKHPVIGQRGIIAQGEQPWALNLFFPPTSVLPFSYSACT